MMAEGFKIGSAYIEVLLEERKARRSAARLDRDLGRSLPDRLIRVLVSGDKRRAESTGAQLGKATVAGFKGVAVAGIASALAGGLGVAIATAAPAALSLAGVFGTVALATDGTKDALDAYSDALKEGKGDFSEYEEALRRLNPHQRAYVEQLVRMGPLVDKLKFAASETFLPGFVQLLKDSEGLFPIFEGHIRRTGEIMDETARKFGDLFKSDEFKKNLDAMFRNADPITRAIGGSFVRLTDKIVEFGSKMDQSALGFANFIDGVTTGLEGFFDKIAEHDESFKRIWDALGRIAEVVLPAVGEAIGKIADAVAPVLEKVADFLEKHKDSIDEVIIALGLLFTTLKAAKLVSAVSGWTKKVIGFIDNIGGASKRNKTDLADFLDLLDPDSKKNKGRRFGQFPLPGGGPNTPGGGGRKGAGRLGKFGALGALGLGTFALGGGMAELGPVDPEEYRSKIESRGMNPDDPQFQMSAFDRWMQELGPKLEGLKTTLTEWGLSIVVWWNGLWGEEGSILTTIRGWGTSILTVFDTAKTMALQKLTEWRDGAVQKATEIVTGIGLWISQLPGQVGAWFQQVWQQVTTWLTNTWTTATMKASEIVTGIGLWIAQLPMKVGMWFQQMWTQATTWLSNLVRDAGIKASETLNGIGQWLGQLPQRALEWFQGMLQAAITKGEELLTWAGELPGKIVEAIGDIASKMVSVGEGIIDGIGRGIDAGWGWLTSKVRSLASDLFQAAKDALGINSPSKVFAEGVGRSIPEGIGVGVIKHARLATDAARRLSGDVVQAGALPPGMVGAGSLRGSQGALSVRQTAALDRLVGVLEAQQNGRQGRPEGDVHVHVEQTSGSPAETGRFVALALRGVG